MTPKKNEDSSLVKYETQLPAHLRDFKGDHRGTENIDQKDLLMPRLRIAQKMSHQVDPSDPKYISGLKVGDLFNDLTGDIYGTGPFHFTVIRVEPTRGVEFYPIEEGGGVKDFFVPSGDPRLEWGAKGEKPVAIKFYDFVLAMLPAREPILLSLKSTGVKVAKRLNALIKYRNAPSFTGLYIVSSVTEQSKKGPFGTYVVSNAGWVTAEEAAWGAEVFDSIKDKTILPESNEDDQPESDESTPF